jgi:hypothetical protein
MMIITLYHLQLFQWCITKCTIVQTCIDMYRINDYLYYYIHTYDVHKFTCLQIYEHVHFYH